MRKQIVNQNDGGIAISQLVGEIISVIQVISPYLRNLESILGVLKVSL